MRLGNETRSMCPLLRIPGELRNQIYKYVLVTVIDEAACRRMSESPYRGNPIYHIPAEYHMDQARKMSLLHVCRQTRQEYRSLYLRYTPCLYMDLVPAYIEAFHPTSTPFSAEIEPLGCKISIDSDVELQCLAKLLTTLYDHPQIDFKFLEFVEGDPTKILQRLFKDRALAWKTALGATVKEIVFSVYSTWTGVFMGWSLDIFVDLSVESLAAQQKSRSPTRLDETLADMGLARTDREVDDTRDRHDIYRRNLGSRINVRSFEELAEFLGQKGGAIDGLPCKLSDSV
ncbi:uncharacterized protein N0V89_010433 [Didymosphaeria variabile]|uniref:F-box domain-containing protein n=1 Tax=Didymosphaeria variabile TaxID=1932322 RepID=A0A9W9C661_9PLEO|nr:uncharacterized protein N0V89_010433 [Didymosphaeria variabile]KAJ4346504.1 hypothetical protein N0V89_010433 [Didymosphaeria variabile]